MRMNSVLAQYPSDAMLPESKVVSDKFLDCNVVSKFKHLNSHTLPSQITPNDRKKIGESESVKISRKKGQKQRSNF